MTHHPDLTKLRHLKATIEGFFPHGRGNCFQQAVAMVMDVPTAKLIVGTLSGDHDYLHAWVEDRGVFYDPSRFVEDGGLKAFDRSAYIERERARDVRVVKRKWVLDFTRRGALSRWILRSEVRGTRFGGIMGHVMLDELGIPYRVNERGYLYPRQESAA